MVTPRNETEARLLDGLHRQLTGYRDAASIYDRRVTRHVHDALKRWEREGVVQRSPRDRWTSNPYWQIHPDHVDRNRRRRILCEEAGALLQRQVNAQKDIAQYTATIQGAKTKMIDLMGQWERTGEALGEIETTSRGVAFAATRLAQRQRALDVIAEQIDELRERVADEGFDPDAVMAGRADDTLSDGDPLGEGA